LRALHRFAVPAALSVMAAAAPAQAQVTQAVQPENASLSSTSAESTNVQYWEAARKRMFVAATIELGLAYVRTQLATGYGRPHYAWTGIELQTGVSAGSFGEYLGLRGALPWGYLRGGIRYQAAFERSILPIKDHYTRQDLDTPIGDPWQYFIFEAETSATAKLPFGNLTAVLGGYYFTLVPERDAAIFEESLKVVATQPWLWRARGSYSLAFGRDDGGRLGLAGEVVGMPNRGEFVLRAGPYASVAVTRHLEVVGMLLPVLYSPDSLGLMGADFGQLGIRLRYATDEKRPDVRE
jgi:hypothetical protein